VGEGQILRVERKSATACNTAASAMRLPPLEGEGSRYTNVTDLNQFIDPDAELSIAPASISISLLVSA